MEIIKVKCKMCGKVASESDQKAQKRHLQFAHNIKIPVPYKTDNFFVDADPDAVVELKACPAKEYRKNNNKKWRNWKKQNKSTLKHTHGRPFVRIIYTPMKNG